MFQSQLLCIGTLLSSYHLYQVPGKCSPLFHSFTQYLCITGRPRHLNRQSLPPNWFQAVSTISHLSDVYCHKFIRIDLNFLFLGEILDQNVVSSYKQCNPQITLFLAFLEVIHAGFPKDVLGLLGAAS